IMLRFYIIYIFAFVFLSDARLSITTDPSPVTAQLGSDVVLKCDFTVDAPTPDLQYLIVKWFFNDTDLAEFNDKLIPSSSKVTMSEREIQNGNASLSIPKVTPADEGDYKCFVLYTPDKEEKTIRLKVEAPPRIQVSDPLIYKGRVNTLTCSASGYYPEDIRVMWLKDGQVLHNANLSTPQRNTHGTFNILCSYTFTPTMEDKDKTYSCHVNHTALRGPIQKDLQFVEAAPPSIQVSDPLIYKDRENTFSCSASGYYPDDIRVMWLKDGQDLKDAKLSSPQRNTDGTFNILHSYTFTPTEQDKDKTYSCHVNHTALWRPLQKDLQ
uniref:Ig-like domain-containing protein n=1 Tax=Latimeria chalumnae TaxID=7897 RepID=H3AXD9_LATCH